MAAGSGPRLALVGARSPVGAEARRRLEASDLVFGDVVLAEVEPLDAEGGRLLGEFAGEALLVTDAVEVDFERFDLAILLGESAAMAPVLERARRARCCIDASGAARGHDDAAWFAMGVRPDEEIPGRGLVAVPHPAAGALARILAPLAAKGLVESAAATVLQPAAALGLRSVEELHSQAVGILNFQDPPREQLQHQLAFNVLAWADPGRPGSAELAGDVAWDVGRVLGADAPGIDVQVLLSPLFHGYGYSVRLALAPDAAAEAVRDAWEDGGLTVGGAGTSPVDAVQADRLLIGASGDGPPGVVWAWVVDESLGAGAAADVVRVARRAVEVAAAAGSAP